MLRLGYIALVLGFAFVIFNVCIKPSSALEGRAENAEKWSSISFIPDELPENLVELNIGDDGNAIVRELRRGNHKLKEIALTFDDGPHPIYTSKILSILRYYRVPATFFMVGVQAERYPEWVKMVFQEGHEIGSHTYDHFRLVDLPYDEQVYQIEEFQRLIHTLTGVYPKFIRPPGGRYNKFTVELMNQNGLALGLWDINSKDGTDVSSEKMLRSILESVQNGSIILLHDGSPTSVEVLPLLIETLKRRGFQFVTMSQMLIHSNSELLAKADSDNRGTSSPGSEKSPEAKWKVYSY